MKQHRVELLAPAGNMEAFMGAIHAGADAVYLAGSKFGARAYADNFTEEELISCIRYAHIFGRKIYLTVNTLMKDDELAELYDYLAPLYKVGLDAVIVQDLGVFAYIKRNFPQMELHVSTQMTITGANGAAMLKEMGASRIVPARELSLKEIVHMKEKTGLEIETFIHGAMCYCYSGQCLFSSILGGRSGNRGRCAQPCRLPYSVEAAGKHLPEAYPLSLKDMCTIEHIGEFIDAGIDSFKIEGRMKKPEYAAGVTAIYRKYIDRKLASPEKALKIDPEDLKNLTSLYIRSERQDGYYYKHNGADIVTLNNPAYSGSDDKLLKEIRQKYIDTTLKLPVSIYASFYCGCEVSVTYVCKDISVTVTGDVMEPANNKPITEEVLEKQLKKLGDTCFETEDIQISTDGQGFYSLKEINVLRRTAVQQLEEQLIQSHGLPSERALAKRSECFRILNNAPQNYWTVLVTTIEQLKEVNKTLKTGCLSVKRIYIESELFLKGKDLPLPDGEIETFIALPYVMRQKDEDMMHKLLSIMEKKDRICGVLFRNLEEYQFLLDNHYKGRMISDGGIYVWNHETLNFWHNKTDGITCPLELNKREWQALFHDKNVEKTVYGRLPMMITANCISKTAGKCVAGQTSSAAYITDRYKKKFPVLIQCNYCMNIILNSVPLSLHSKECLKWYDQVVKRISFTVENEIDVKDILNFFTQLQKDMPVSFPFEEYTSGHEKRGVE